MVQLSGAAGLTLLLSVKRAGKYHQNSAVAVSLKCLVLMIEVFKGATPAPSIGNVVTPGYVDLNEISERSRIPNTPRTTAKNILEISVELSLSLPLTSPQSVSVLSRRLISTAAEEKTQHAESISRTTQRQKGECVRSISRTSQRPSNGFQNAGRQFSQAKNGKL